MRRRRKSSLAAAMGRAAGAFARIATRSSAKRAVAVSKAVHRAWTPVRPSVGKGDWISGQAIGPAGLRHYRLFKPAESGARRPLLLMLHGCHQDATRFARSTGMNRAAERAGFMVLYVEQDLRANAQGCWNWFDTRSRRAYAEAATILSALDQVCLLYSADRERIAVAGLSAGASMASLLATRYPERFRAVIMHSGVPPGVATSAASAITAMRGHHPIRATPSADSSRIWPPLLIVQGTADSVVAPANAIATARLWAEATAADTRHTRTVQRGRRYPMSITEFRSQRRTTVTLCEISGLGHAWSGGHASEAYADARGPDASRMVCAFAARHFR